MTTLERVRTDSSATTGGGGGVKSPYAWANTWRYYNFTPAYAASNPYATWIRPGSGKHSHRSAAKPSVSEGARSLCNLGVPVLALRGHA